MSRRPCRMTDRQIAENRAATRRRWDRKIARDARRTNRDRRSMPDPIPA